MTRPGLYSRTERESCQELRREVNSRKGWCRYMSTRSKQSPLPEWVVRYGPIGVAIAIARKEPISGVDLYAEVARYCTARDIATGLLLWDDGVTRKPDQETVSRAVSIAVDAVKAYAPAHFVGNRRKVAHDAIATVLCEKLQRWVDTVGEGAGWMNYLYQARASRYGGPGGSPHPATSGPAI